MRVACALSRIPLALVVIALAVGAAGSVPPRRAQPNQEPIRERRPTVGDRSAGGRQYNLWDVLGTGVSRVGGSGDRAAAVLDRRAQ
jgi:hypothetical protein